MDQNECTKKYVLIPDGGQVIGPQGPQGPPGPPGGVQSLPISSDDVLYGAITVTQALDALFYVPLVITAFSANQSTYEKGQTLTSIQLSWSFNKAIQAQTITGSGVVPPSLAPSDRAVVAALSNVTTNTTITLTADDVTGDGNAAKTSNINVQFLNKVYYGKAATPGAINSAFVLSLGGQLQNNRAANFNLNTGVTELIWYACPVAYGLPSFTMNGFAGGMNLQGTISFTNASGWTENYYVFGNSNDNLGLTNVVAS